MKKWLLLFALFLAACGDANSRSKSSDMSLYLEKNGKLKILSTIAMIDDIVKTVGGDYVDSITLMRGDLDPHSYQLVKGDDEKLFYAQIVFYNGLGLEHGPSLQNYLETNPKAKALGNQIMQDQPELIIKIDEQVDPHIWMDVSLWAKIVPIIVEHLSENDKAHADYFKERGQKLILEMTKEHDEIKNLLKTIPEEKRFLVSSHDAFNYFARAYLATEEEAKLNKWQDRFAAPEGLAPESQLSPIHIQEILDYLKKHRVQVLFPESNISKDSIRKIVSAGKENGLDIVIAPCCLYADAMGEPGSDADTYLKMVKHNASWIVKHLRGNFNE